jgi:hypothetical protein
MAPFLWSLAMLILGVGFGGFYLAKQLGWFGLEPLRFEGLTLERPGRPGSRWSRYRRLLTAVLLMALGVLCFLGVNWLNPREHLRGSLYFLGSFVALCLATVLLALQDLRELRRLTRSLRTRSRTSPPPRGLTRRFREPGGDGGSAEEPPESPGT